MAIAKKSRNVYTRNMKSSKHIRSQTDILAAFRAVYGGRGDGKRELGNWLSLSHQAICNWFMKPQHGGEPQGIPSGYQGRIMLWAAHHGYVLHASVFGLAPDGTPLSRPNSKAA